MKLLTPLLALCSLFATLTAQVALAPPYDPSAFTSTGLLSSPIVGTSTTGGLAGGSFVVNNQLVVVPENLLVDVPTQSLSWSDFVGAIKGPLHVSVEGNRMGSQFIAGTVFLAEDLAQTHSGFINFIDYVTGSFRVGGTIGDAASGLLVQINDPVGRFGRPQAAYPLFTADTDNPSVAALTGFPMCIPRTNPSVQDDVACPAKNRPKDANGNFMTTFTMPVPSPTNTGPDAMQQAPFQIGDYVTVSGPVGAGGITVFSVVANIAIFTAKGSKPVYLSIDKAEFGITDPQNPGLVIGQTVIEGWTTDAGASINIYALDVDRCTGQATNRILQTVFPDLTPVLGRWRWTPGKITVTASRQILATHSNGILTAANGLMTGQFTFPVPRLTFPAPGAPGTALGQLPFYALPWLVNGAGPYSGSQALKTTGGQQIGQLKPFPGGPPPAQNPATCPAQPAAGTAPPSSPAPGPAPAPAPAPAPPKDTVSITQAQLTRGRGTFITTVSASSSAFVFGSAAQQAGNPTLTLTFLNPAAGPVTMVLNGQTGVYSAQVTSKLKSQTAVVMSSNGGQASRAIV